MNHSQAIANAFRQKWADIKLLNCEPHLFRKARGKKHLLVDSERYFDIIKPQLEYLSEARNAEQFEMLPDLVCENWATLGETEYAQWIHDEYLCDPWDLWFTTASDAAGVVPNHESCNFVIKKVAVTHLRATTGHVLAGTLPNGLVACAKDIGTERIRQFASGPVGAEYLQAAVDLCEDDNHYPTHTRKSRRVINTIQKYYFNADYYVVRDDNLHGLKVDGNRSKTYEASLRGTLKSDEIVENVQLRYLSFHGVKVLDRTTFEHDLDSPSWSIEKIETTRTKFKCDCKTFYQTGWLCAHVLACLHLVYFLDLHVMLRSLPDRKPPGRPRKKTQCLDHDGPRKSQYTVNALIKRLVEKPTSVVSWSILRAVTVTDNEGEQTELNVIGKIKPPFSRGGKRYWNIKVEDVEEPRSMDVEGIGEIHQLLLPNGT